VVAEIIRLHRPAHLVGDTFEGVAQLFLIGVGHQEKVISKKLVNDESR